jgi:uncharacterized membrane protein YeaQ/YmgE (transglycosylase-associated protein family)
VHQAVAGRGPLDLLGKAGAEPFLLFSSRSLGTVENMQIAIWIYVGLAAGWLAGKSLEGKGFGLWRCFALAAVGAVVGGFLSCTVGFSAYGGVFVSTFMAIGCAALLTILAAVASRRAIRARAI